jgi:hypothetical protein
MTFHQYLKQWIQDYPNLDVYYHLTYIEQAYRETYN